MPDPQVVTYIREQLAQNVGKDAITASLKANGWNDQDIAEGFNIISLPQDAVVPTAPALPVQSKSSYVWGVAIVVILILVGAGGWWYWQSSIGKSTVNERNAVSRESDKAGVQAVFDEFAAYVNTMTDEAKQAIEVVAEDYQPLYADSASYADTEILKYKFKTPWGKGVESEQTKNNPGLKQIEFPNGHKILFSCISQTPREEFTNPENSLPETNTNQILSFLGSRADSGYEYTNFLLSTRPADILLQSTTSDARAVSMLLTLKIVTVPSVEVYRFSTQNVRGFHYRHTSRSTDIALFPNDGAYCRIMANERYNIEQKDVDVIISTFQIAN